MELALCLEKLIDEVPSLGVIVYKGGAPVYSRFLEQRGRGKKFSAPITADTRFRAASVSKMFTVFTILQLVAQGKINLDDDISRYLNFELRNPNFPREKITVRKLASHTSSLRDGKIYSSPPEFSLEEFFSSGGRFYEGGAHFGKAQDFFSYSNLNYGVLGTIIERVTGVRFDIYQRENILAQLDTRADYVPANLTRADFEKLGATYLKNSNGDWCAKIDDFKDIQPTPDTLALQNPYNENVCQVYDLKNYRAGTNATIFSPQGGLRISFEELAHTLEMLMNGGKFRGKQILQPELLAEMLTPQWIYNGKNGETCGGVFLSYGLGIYFIYGTKNNRLCKNFAVNLIGHSGAAFGLLSGLFFIPNTKTGFIYIMNGTPLDVESDPRAQGIFSSNYIFEERICDAICNFIHQ